MAQIVYRVSGRDGDRRVSRTFRNTDEGRQAAAAYRKQLSDVSNRYDVRTRIGARVVTRTFASKKEADAYASTIEVDRLRGVMLDPGRGRVTVRELGAEWMASNPAKRDDTRATDEYHLNTHIFPELGDRRIDSIMQTDVQSLVNQLSARLAPRTVRRGYGVLRSLCAYAEMTDRIGRSPCRNVKLPAVQPLERSMPLPDDLARLVEAMDQRYRPMVYLGAVLGLRFSEVAALRVGRIDLVNGSVSVNETITRDSRGRPVSDGPKSAASRRTISLPPALRDMLAAHLSGRGLSGDDPDALVFVSPEGGPLRYSNWRNRVWVPAREAAGLPKLGFHDLRRAMATALVQDRTDLKTTQIRMGHSDPRTTLALYAQAVSEADQAAADSLGNRFMSAPRDERAMNEDTES
ncbi:MAG: tyrosine-type recombinase/integrase [Acidimicrobiales bacterium]